MDTEPAPAAVPDWWQPYARMFPDWHAWTGVSGLRYARLPGSSPPRVVWSASAADVPEMIRALPVPWWRRPG